MAPTHDYPSLASLNLRSLGQSVARLDHYFQAIVRNRFGAVAKRLSAFVEPGHAILDIGANHGKFTKNFARLHDGRCPVLAFEPLPYNFSILKRVTRGFPNVRRVNAAVSDRAGTADLFVPAKQSGRISPGAAHLGETTAPADFGTATARQVYKITVPTETLDALLARQPTPPIDLLKIDVQGAETYVFRGAASTLAAHHPAIYVEISPGCPEYFGLSVHDSVGALQALGYTAFSFADDGALIRHDRFDERVRDYLFLHAARHAAQMK